MFYIYEWFIVETGEIIYVGKGTGNRYKNKKKNKMLNRLIQDNNCDVRIIDYYATEKEAFEAERQRIIYCKSIGQAICNKAIYSTGGVASIWDEERRKRMSENNPMKADCQRKRMSENNPMKNPDVAKRVGEKRRIKVEINGDLYESVTIAAKHFGVSQATIKNWQKSGKAKYIVSNNEDKHIEIKSINNNHKIVYLEKEYENGNMLASDLGVHPTTIMQWLKKGFDTKGNPCRYKDDNNEYVFVPVNKKTRSIPIIVDGVRYTSIKEAANELAVSEYTLYNYLKGKVKHPRFKCEYDNQQPSQMKSDNSNLEGSETNE